MKFRKVLLLAALSFAALTSLAACTSENVKYAGGNEMVSGSRTYEYAYVCSKVTGNKYYHISGWKEYGPEGGVQGETTGVIAPYVGLELQLYTSKDVVYYYEPGLMYVLTKNYDASLGRAIE